MAPPSTKVPVPCKTCGKIFKCPLHRTKSSENIYCSRACYFKSRLKPKLEIPCDHCGKLLERLPRIDYGHDHVYCSRECFDAYRRKEVEVICAECGKVFVRKLSALTKTGRNFCSKKCTDKRLGDRISGANHPRWKNLPVIPCEYCGQEFRKIHSRHRFCSEPCRDAWIVKTGAMAGPNHGRWKGGHPDYYGINWLRQAHLARQRDGYKCRCCGVTQKKRGPAFDVHHIIPFRQFGYVRFENDAYILANHLDNLVTLCRACHRLVEDGKIPLQPTLLSVT